MVTVKISELLEKAQEMLSAGYEYVNVCELDADDDIPKALHFEAYDSSFGGGIDFEDVDHGEVPGFSL